MYTNRSNGKMSEDQRLDINVWIYPDGQVKFQRLLDSHPVGGLPPTQLTLTCVNDDLLTGLDGSDVITVGVARAPAEANPPG